MDVRCDRCETEYELDDGIVTDAGASVQCTTCGHTFFVTRRPSSPLNQLGLTQSGSFMEESGPNVPEWTLSTDDGRVHRFRDLNVLQKWVVERKVTRTDQISRSGGPWLSLADVVELSPFFNVVDEADRARTLKVASPFVAPAPAPAPMPMPIPVPTDVPIVAAPLPLPASPAPPRVPSGITPPPLPPDARRPVSEDGPTVPNRRLPGGAEISSIPEPGIRPTEPRTTPPRASEARLPGMGGGGGGRRRPTAPASLPAVRDDVPPSRQITAETTSLASNLSQESHRGRNAALVLVALAAAAGGGYWWWTQQPGPATADSAARPSHEPPSAAGQGTVTTGSSSARGASGGPAAEAPPSRPPSALATGGDVKTGGGPSAATPETTADRLARLRPGAAEGTATSGVPPRSGRTPAASLAGRSPGGYERLVADGDRFLDRGQSAKADKLYAQALALRPDGVTALTGAAYVHLDRQRHFKAIETFRRALAIQPNFGPALFGIAESYRARGDNAQALGAYRQYLATTPTGADAPAARRQIKDLESGGPATTPSPERSIQPAAPADE